MRLTVCLEGNGEGRVLTSLDMEDIVKMTQTNDVTKCNLTTEALAEHDKQIRDEVISEIINKIKHIGYVHVCVDCLTKHNLIEMLEQMEGEQNELL